MLLFDNAELLALAGSATFERGAVYFAQAKVRSCEVAADGVRGSVAGGALYAATLARRGRRLVAACTCPVGDRPCKHAVALGLHYLASHPAPEVERAGGAGDPVFETRAELEAWAAAHQVVDAIRVTADRLVELLPGEVPSWLRGLLARLAVRDVGSLEGARRHVHHRGVDLALARVARDHLTALAAAVHDGRDEELARADHAPRPALAPLWVALLRARRPLRELCAPRSRAWRATGTWAFDVAAARASWREPDHVIRARDFARVPVVATLELPAGGEPRFTCTCAATRGHCAHALALVDAALDLLADSARAEQAEALAGELLRPSWDRALAELDALDARIATPRAAIEVWWMVEEVLGSATLTPTVKKQTKRGMSAGARVSPRRLLDDHRAQLAETDLRAAEQLAAWQPGHRAMGSYPARAFDALVGHPRVVDDDGDPIEIARLPLGFTALASGDAIRLEPSLAGVRFPPVLLAALLDAFPAGEPLFTLDRAARRALLIDAGDDARALWAVLQRHGDAFPPESHAPLLERLARFEGRLPLSVPAALKGVQLAAAAVTVIRLRLLADATLELEVHVRPAPGAPLFPPGNGPRDVLIVRDGARGFVRRDLDAEPVRVRAQLADLLSSAGAKVTEGPPNCFQLAEPDDALTVVAVLQTPPPGVVVEWLDAPAVVSPAPPAAALRVSVERKRDWFGISGEMLLDSSRLELAVLLDAARRQQRYVRVDDRRWMELSEALRERLLAVADRTFTTRGRLELSPGAVPAIKELAEAGATVDTAPAWDVLTERLTSSRTLRPTVPAALVATLRDYQVEGHAWLMRVAAWGAGACLADDMGLGKTVQAIALLLDRARSGPALVLAPTSVTYNWASELARFAPTLRPVIYGELADRSAGLSGLRKKDVVIASYGLLARDAAPLAAVSWGTLIVDEAQALKNPATLRARAARELRAGFRVALTGTPLENHLGELWSLYAIVFPGLLGSWDQFRTRFAFPIERGKDPEARAALARVLRPFLLRRTKQEVARELPARTEIEVPVALSTEERALYDDARIAAIAELGRGASAAQQLGDNRQRFAVLAALTRLRLLASHPRLYDPTSTVPSAKLRRLLELVSELRSEGHRALIFSQFTSHLALVKEALDREGITYLYLDGGTPAAERRTLIDRFQAGEGDAFLISLKAGGTGINLTAADYVIHLDPWWNPAVEDQATDRAHRIGQTRPVTVLRLIARGTIEDQILALHGDKRALVAGVLEGSDAAGRLTTRDLLELLQAS